MNGHNPSHAPPGTPSHPSSTNTASHTSPPLRHAAAALSSFTTATSQSFRQWTTKTYALPDRTVASQVLMYRQLLHTACRPGLKLSRPYTGTPAQQSVRHMPWWHVTVDPLHGTPRTMVETGVMSISYDNLILRLWNALGCVPQVEPDRAIDVAVAKEAEDALEEATFLNQPVPMSDESIENEDGVVDVDITTTTANTDDDAVVAAATDTTSTKAAASSNNNAPPKQPSSWTKDGGAAELLHHPPIPDPQWVSTGGFQQDDPVTDFRSGGVLSLALLVYICERCPHVHDRFRRNLEGGDNTNNKSTGKAPSYNRSKYTVGNRSAARVLPLALTSINVTALLSELLLLQRKTDRMDALLSQKPFWSMFADPSALLACQELALDLLADVVQELDVVRRLERTLQHSTTTATTIEDENAPAVSVFDFPHILQVTQQRVEHDLLGAGPLSVKELYLIHSRLQTKYEKQLQAKLERMMHKTAVAASPNNNTSSSSGSGGSPSRLPFPTPVVREQVLKHATGVGAAATGLFSKLRNHSPLTKGGGFGGGVRSTPAASTTTTTAADLYTAEFDSMKSPSTDRSNEEDKGDGGSGVIPPEAATTNTGSAQQDALQAAVDFLSEEGWVGTNDNDNGGVSTVTEQIDNFSIGDDGKDEDLLL